MEKPMDIKPADIEEKQVEMRLVKKEDLEALKEIWKLSFGDEDSFIDFYFQNRDWLSETAVLLSGGRIVSMLTMIPVDMIGDDGEKYRASMLYAIATHPEFQKQGFAEQLIEFSNQYLLSIQVSVTLLVPAGEELFRFYEKRGYRNGFFVREAVLSREEIDQLAGKDRRTETNQPDGQNQTPCRVTPVTPLEYNSIRRELLMGRQYLDYRDAEISFEKQLARMYGTDIYAIEIDDLKGCAYAERISQDELIIKELLIPDQYLPAILRQLAELLPGEKYIVRTPRFSGGILGGAVRSFGMLRVNSAAGSKDSNIAEPESYLGIAYD